MSLPVAMVLALQVAQAGVAGTVRDELSGAALAGVLVSLPDVDRRVLTDDQGRFGFTALAPGPQHINIARQGYGARTLHALIPRRGVVELDVALRPVPMELAGLLVEPRMAIRGAEPPYRRDGREAVSAAAVRNHPMLAEPDVFRVLEGGDVALLPESHTGLHVRGGAAGHTAFEIDGIPVLGPVHAAGLVSAWNPDALASVRLDSGVDGVLPSLSGTVVGETRRPGARLRGRTVLSTTQGRVSVDGPLGGGAGYVVGLRQGFPNGFARPRDPAKIRGEAGDVLAKLDVPLGGGTLRVLGYGSENELDAGVVADAGSAPVPRSGFEWTTQALGATWSRDTESGRVELRAWDSRARSAVSLLGQPAGPTGVENGRLERGIRVTASRRTAGDVEATVGARLTRGRTEYAVARPGAIAAEGALTTGALLVGLGAPLGGAARIGGALDLAVTTVGVRASPRLTASLRLSPSLTVSAAATRRHQLAQSLRNEESLLGTVFPTDLFVTAGSGGVPVARADEIETRVELRPSAGVTLGGQLHARSLTSVVFVAPSTGSLYASDSFEVGSTAVRGVSLDLALSGSRYGVVVDYAAQRVRNRVPGRSYVPSYAPRHRAQAGLVLHVTPTLSLRVAQAGLWGRRATSLLGPVEWEACNLADGGCELAGSVVHADTPSDVRPGSYLRTDVGVRKHWHVDVRGRDASVAVYGTLTNVLGRPNRLTYALDPTSGGLEAIDMLSFVPLVVGFEVAF